LWIQQKNAKDAPISAMNDRENAFEAKCAHDAKMQFKAEARGNKLLGEKGADAQAYAVEVVKSDFEEAGDEDVFRKVSGYLDGSADEATIHVQMSTLIAKAKTELMSEL
jgi:hypothetical protein